MSTVKAGAPQVLSHEGAQIRVMIVCGDKLSRPPQTLFSLFCCLAFLLNKKLKVFYVSERRLFLIRLTSYCHTKKYAISHSLKNYFFIIPFTLSRLPVPAALPRLEGSLQAGTHEGLAVSPALPRPRNRFHARQGIEHRRHTVPGRSGCASFR